MLAMALLPWIAAAVVVAAIWKMLGALAAPVVFVLTMMAVLTRKGRKSK
jgi:hypothetical protein